VALALAATLAAGLARSEWLQPDESYKDAVAALRAAQRDTAGHGDDPGKLDTLGVALLRLGRKADASRVFRSVIERSPADRAAAAGLGKIALHAGRLGEAESLLAVAGTEEPGVLNDVYALRLRRGDWAGAAKLAEEAGQPGRVPLLEKLAETPPYQLEAEPKEVRLIWSRTHPVPLIRVKLEGESVLMALDTGAGDVVVDRSVARRLNVQLLPGEWPAFWMGSRVPLRSALVRHLEIGGVRLENVPGGVHDLGKWTLQLNPYGERVAGVIGIGVLRQFTPTLDYERNRLLLLPGGTAPASGPGASRVPFEIWGENELMVYGTIAGGRRMAMAVQTGIPECGIAAPAEVFEELGLKPGGVAKMMKSVGALFTGRAWTEVAAPSVAVGPILKNSVSGWSGAMDSGEMWRHGVRRDAILSSDFFRGRAVTVDWARQELIFEERD
jgi:hypothetical protein